MNADEKIDAIRKLNKAIDEADIKDKEDVREYVKNITSIIWDYKIIGKVYEIYPENVDYYKENCIEFHTNDDVAKQILGFTSEFPDVIADIEHIIVYKVNDDFYKVFRRLRYKGTNTGYTKYGAPTGRSLEDKCLNLSLFHLKRIDGEWKIPFEVNSDSAGWIREVETVPLAENAEE